MSFFPQLMLAIILTIFFAKVGGQLAVRVRAPMVLGELLAGVFLGPTLLNIFAWPVFDTAQVEGVMTDFSQLGVIFIMFISGLESDTKALQESGRASALTGTLGVIAPLLLGFVVASLFGYAPVSAAFVGVVLTATSVSVTAETLRELGQLRSRIGTVLLGAAVFDDVLGLLVLSFFLALTTESGAAGVQSVITIVARIAIFLSGATLIGWWLLPTLARWTSQLRSFTPQVTFSLALVTGLTFAWSSEIVGSLASITGAYLAGAFLSRTDHRDTIVDHMQGLVYGLFAPIFFVSIGIQTNGRLLFDHSLGFAGAIIIVAIVSKIIGCGTGARLSGLTSSQSLQAGVGMISRGEVGLIVATIGMSQGIIGQDVFATTVIVVLVTTLVTPILLSVTLKDEKNRQEPSDRMPELTYEIQEKG